LENRRSKDDKIFRGMWKAVKTKAGEARMAEAEEERKKGRTEKETREERTEKGGRKKRQKKPKKKRIMEVKKIAEEWKIWDKEEEAAKSEKESKKIGTRMISLIDTCLWKETE